MTVLHLLDLLPLQTLSLVRVSVLCLLFFSILLFRLILFACPSHPADSCILLEPPAVFPHGAQHRCSHIVI